MVESGWGFVPHGVVQFVASKLHINLVSHCLACADTSLSAEVLSFESSSIDLSALTIIKLRDNKDEDKCQRHCKDCRVLIRENCLREAKHFHPYTLAK